MIVSHNEIVTMVNKVFLGMQREVGEADLIASMVAELQMAGLNGILHFNNASPFILSERDVAIDIIYQGKGEVRLDLHGSSLVCHLPAVMDYVIEKMGSRNHFKVYLQNCHNRWLAYSELAKLAAKGIACLAKWDNGSAPKHTIFTLDKRFVYPDLYFLMKRRQIIIPMTWSLSYQQPTLILNRIFSTLIVKYQQMSCMQPIKGHGKKVFMLMMGSGQLLKKALQQYWSKTVRHQVKGQEVYRL